MGWLIDNTGGYVLDNLGNRIWIGEGTPVVEITTITYGLKGIKENLITSVDADSENSNYPAENVLDDHPKQKWIADGDYQATLTCQVAAGSNALAIFGTNATSALVSISDPNQVEWEAAHDWENGVEWSNLPIETDEIYQLTQQGNGYALWLDFGFTVNATLEITITLVVVSTDVVEAGVVVVGPTEGVQYNPMYGLKEGLIDYSLVKELSNGARWTKKRDVVRTFGGQVFAEREREFYNFMYEIAREIGPDPIAWKITDLDTDDWIVYGALDGMPSGTHAYPNHTPIDFAIREVL